MEDIYYAIKSRAYEIAQYSVEKQYKIQSVWSEYGSAGYMRALEDSRYHISTIASAYALSSPGMLTEYFAWLEVLFERLKLPDNSAKDSLAFAAQAIDTVLQLDTAIERFVSAALEHAGGIREAEAQSALTPEAKTYRDFLFGTQQREALDHIMSLKRRGASVLEIYNDIFIPVQLEIGELWHRGKISVAQEHYSTAVTQLALAMLYQSFFTGEKRKHTIVAAAVAGELHELPIRFVADVFEMRGWRTHYYGASTPLTALLETIRDKNPSLVCLSATMPYAVPELEQYIKAIKKEFKLPVLAGGRPFIQNPDLYRSVGADGTAENASKAVEAAEALV